MVLVNWYWLIDGLQDRGFSAHLANTTAIKQYDGLKHRGDESDARHLAHVFRLGLFPTGYIMPKEPRAVRDLARKRMQLVQQRSTHILSIETQMDQQHGVHLSSNLIKKLSCSDIDAMGLEAMASLAMKAKVSLMQSTDQQVDLIEKALASYCRHHPGFPLLKTGEVFSVERCFTEGLAKLREPVIGVG